MVIFWHEFTCAYLPHLSIWFESNNLRKIVLNSGFFFLWNTLYLVVALFHYCFVIDALKTGTIKATMDVVKHDDHRVLEGGELAQGWRLSSMDRFPDAPSDVKPALSAHAKARSGTDSDLLAIIAVKGEKIRAGILEAQTLSNSSTYTEGRTACCM